MRDSICWLRKNHQISVLKVRNYYTFSSFGVECEPLGCINIKRRNFFHISVLKSDSIAFNDVPNSFEQVDSMFLFGYLKNGKDPKYSDSPMKCVSSISWEQDASPK